MSSKDLARYRDIINEAQTLDEITRRGVLKGMGAAAAAAATKTNPLAAPISVPVSAPVAAPVQLTAADLKLKNTMEDVYNRIKSMMYDAKNGEDVTDDIADELNDYYFSVYPEEDDRGYEDDDVETLSDPVLQDAYRLVGDTADTSPEEQYEACKQALEMIRGIMHKRGYDSVKDDNHDDTHYDNHDANDDYDDSDSSGTLDQIAKSALDKGMTAINRTIDSPKSLPIVDRSPEEPVLLTKSDEQPLDQELELEKEPDEILREYINIVSGRL